VKKKMINFQSSQKIRKIWIEDEAYTEGIMSLIKRKTKSK